MMSERSAKIIAAMREACKQSDDKWASVYDVAWNLHTKRSTSITSAYLATSIFPSMIKAGWVEKRYVLRPKNKTQNYRVTPKGAREAVKVLNDLATRRG